MTDICPKTNQPHNINPKNKVGVQECPWCGKELNSLKEYLRSLDHSEKKEEV